MDLIEVRTNERKYDRSLCYLFTRPAHNIRSSIGVDLRWEVNKIHNRRKTHTFPFKRLNHQAATPLLFHSSGSSFD